MSIRSISQKLSLIGALAACFSLLAPGGLAAQEQASTPKIITADLQGYCKKHHDNARVRFNYARQEWVCAIGTGAATTHKNIQMGLACQLANSKATYSGIRNGVPICTVPSDKPE